MIRISANTNRTDPYQSTGLALYGAEQVRFGGHELIDIHRAYLDKLDRMANRHEHDPPQWNRASYDGGIGKRSTQRAKALVYQCHWACDPGITAELQPLLAEYERILDIKLKRCMSFWQPCNQSNEILDLLQELDFWRKVDALNLPDRVAERVKDCRETLRLDLYEARLARFDPDCLDSLFELVRHRVPKLQTLTLEGNGLTYVPPAVCKLTRLKRLNLGRNLITCVPDTLGNLTMLRVLNLGDNRLTSLSDTMGALTEVSHLNLGNNPLSRIPEALGDMRSLSILDLSGTMVREVPSQLRERMRSGRVATSDESFPDEWRIQHYLAQRITDRQSIHPLAHTDNSLRQSILALGFDENRAGAWARFESERWASSFSAWLTGLTGTADGEQLQKNAGMLLDAMEKDPVLRAGCFAKAQEFTSTCHDNIAWGLLEFTLDMHDRQIELAHPADKELIRHGRAMYAVSLMKEAAQAKGNEIRKNTPMFREDLEIALFYVLNLKHLLPISVPIEKMKYETSVPRSINDSDIKALQAKIMSAMEDTEITPDFLSFMSAWVPLQGKLDGRKARARSVIDENAQSKVEALLNDDGRIEESKTLEACKQAALERQNALKDLDTVVTREYFTELGIALARRNGEEAVP